LVAAARVLDELESQDPTKKEDRGVRLVLDDEVNNEWIARAYGPARSVTTDVLRLRHDPDRDVHPIPRRSDRGMTERRNVT